MSAKNLRDIKNVADEEMALLNDVRLSLISTLTKRLRSEIKEATRDRNSDKRKKITKIVTIQDFLKGFRPKAIKTDKETYFHYISKNNILDMSDTSNESHMKTIPSHLKNIVNLNTDNPPTKDVVDEVFKVIMNKKKPLHALLKEIKDVHPANRKQSIQQEIFRFCLDLHVHKSHFFSSENISQYSEEDYKIKFWSHIMEEYFSNVPVVLLHWGDTVPNTFKSSALIPKMDLRIVSSLATTIPRLFRWEFAKKATKSKLYIDKLKAALVTKKHINLITSHLTSILKCCVYLFYKLWVSISAFSICNFFNSNQLYLIKNDHMFSFPVTKKDIENGEIQKLINCLETIKESCNILKDIIEDKRKGKNTNVMNNILGDSSNNDYLNWKTNVIWPRGIEDWDDEGQDDEDQDDEDQGNESLDDEDQDNKDKENVVQDD